MHNIWLFVSNVNHALIMHYQFDDSVVGNQHRNVGESEDAQVRECLFHTGSSNQHDLSEADAAAVAVADRPYARTWSGHSGNVRSFNHISRVPSQASSSQ